LYRRINSIYLKIFEIDREATGQVMRQSRQGVAAQACPFFVL
jgi:hypothetical protein